MVSLIMLAVQILGILLLTAPARADRSIDLGMSPQFWSLAMSVGRSNALYVTEGGENAAGWDFALAPTIVLNRDYTLGALIEYAQDMREEDLDFGRASISFKRASGYQMFVNRVRFTPGINLGLPISRAAKAASLQASTTLSGRFDANPDYLFSKRFSLGGSISITRNFHQYDTAYKGTVNTAWASNQALDTGWAFTDWMSVGLTLGHFDTISYQGVAKDYLYHSESLNFSLSRRSSLAVGHSWGKPYVSTRKYDGQSLNVEAADIDNSMVFATFTYVL